MWLRFDVPVTPDRPSGSADLWCEPRELAEKVRGLGPLRIALHLATDKPQDLLDLAAALPALAKCLAGRAPVPSPPSDLEAEYFVVDAEDWTHHYGLPCASYAEAQERICDLGPGARAMIWRVHRVPTHPRKHL